VWATMHYRVIVSCAGHHWMIRIPAFGMARVVEDKKNIRATARSMIESSAYATADFELELVAGRALGCDEASAFIQSVGE